MGARWVSLLTIDVKWLSCFTGSENREVPVGQYYLLVNPDKKQFVHSHDVKSSFRDFRGLKLMEMGYDDIIPLLIAHGNGKGGGDFQGNSPLVGSWAGDRVILTGDYANEGEFLTEEQIAQFKADFPKEELEEGEEPPTPNLQSYAYKYFENISEKVTEMLEQDH